MALSGSAIFCDDIRQEANGKYILIGVYTGNMAVSSFPTAQKVCAFLQLDNILPGTQLFEYSTAEGATFGVLALEMAPEPDATPPFFLPIPPVAVNVSQPTIVRLRTRSEADEAWSELASLKVQIADEAIRSAFQP